MTNISSSYKSQFIDKSNFVNGEVVVDESLAQEQEIQRRVCAFRQAVDELLCGSRDSPRGEAEFARKNKFLKAVERKCSCFNKCLSPSEVISEAYWRAYESLLQGKEIHNPEAWMKKAIWNILREDSRSKARNRKRSKSFDSAAHDDGQPLSEKIPSSQDMGDADEVERLRVEHKRVRGAFEKLTPKEQRLLTLKEIEGKTWSEVAKTLKFKGKLPALRKQGSRAIGKLKGIYLDS